MKYTDDQIKRELREFALVTGQPELRHVISYALGYYGYITNQIWRQIQELEKEGVIK